MISCARVASVNAHLYAQLSTTRGRQNIRSARSPRCACLFDTHEKVGYSPSTQGFISEDPIGFSGGDVNLYAYVSNDPVNYTDPSGHSLVGRIARLVGGKLLEGRRITMREAQQIRRLEGNIIMDEQRIGRQVESGAFRNDRTGEHAPRSSSRTGLEPALSDRRKKGTHFLQKRCFLLSGELNDAVRAKLHY